ncbi:ferredoxin:protochlorophyllide reductase (ATP-dependent) subunit B, partial [Methylobacterium sp. D48H]
YGTPADGAFEAAGRAPAGTPPTPAPVPVLLDRAAAWSPEAEKELKKIPFFVRGKARTNTETFARERHLPPITVETLYDAKAHFGR